MDWVLRHPRKILLALTLVVLALGHRAPLVRQDNSPETFFAADEQAERNYYAMRAAFPGDEVLLVELRGARLDRAADVRAVARLAHLIEMLPAAVLHVSSVADALPPREDSAPGEDGEAGASASRPVEEPPEQWPDSEHLLALQKEVRALSFYRELGLVRPDVPSLGILVSGKMDPPVDRIELTSALQKVASQFSGYTPLVAGLTPANAAIDRLTRRSLSRFLPLTVVLVLIIGLVLFRSPRALLAMVLPVGGAVLVGVGLLALTDEPLSIVTGIMPPLVLAIGFAGAVHMVSHYGACAADGCPPAEALRATLQDKLVPTAFAFLTTAVGFGSLALSQVHPVRVLGLVSAAALLAAMAGVTLGTPLLLYLLRPRLHSPAQRRRRLEVLAIWALRRRRYVLGVALAGLPLVFLGLLRLRPSIDGMELLGDQVPEKQAFRKLESEGLGLNAVDLWIRGPVPDHAALVRDAPRLAKLAAEGRRHPGVTASLGVHDLLRVFQYRSTGQTSLPASLDALELLEPEQQKQFDERLRPLWNPTRGLKLTLMTRLADPESVAALERRVRARAATLFPGRELVLSGHFSMLLGTAGALMRTLSQSLGLSVLIIGVLFTLAFRSPRLVFSGLIVSLLPVAGVLALMGWLGIRVDIATVMIGSVAFGVAVDDTFHYLYHRREAGGILRAAAIAGQGIVATSLMISGGFLVLALSAFTPLVRFGLLTAAAVLASLALDALLLPALVGCKDDPECQGRL